MKNNILVVGIGNIGKRYLEAILRLKNINYIYIFDKNKKVRENLKIFYSKNTKIKILNDLNQLKIRLFKLCIVSTVSKKRLELIKFLERKFIIKNYIIEKILEQNSAKIIEIKEALNKKLNFSWVNLPYGSIKFYKTARQHLNEKTNKAIITGSNLDLASNVVHFIYWYSLLVNSKFEKLLIKKNSYFINSKRKNFKEMFGVIFIFFKNGFKLTIKSKKSKHDLSINHKIYNKKNETTLLLDENSGMIKNKKKIVYKKIENLSLYMQVIIKNILAKRKCSLPKISDIYVDHASVIKYFLDFYNKKYHKGLRNLNIT